MESKLVVYTRPVSKRFDPVLEAIVPDVPSHIVWEYWKYERSYHGTPGEYNLGEI